MYFNRNTFISATRQFLKTSCTHETHYWGLNSLTMLQWTSTSGKLRVFEYSVWNTSTVRFKSPIQFCSVISIFVFVVNRLRLRSVDHSLTHSLTHQHKHGSIIPSQKPITTKNTTKPRYKHTCPERELNLFYLQSTDLTPHGHKERRLFIYCILNKFFLKTFNSSFDMDRFKISANIFRCKFLSALL